MAAEDVLSSCGMLLLQWTSHQSLFVLTMALYAAMFYSDVYSSQLI